MEKQNGSYVACEPGVLQYSYKVTAIVSVFRAERFMQGLLEDLERQTIASELEIVIVDAASDENEKDIIEEYQLRNTNIQYVRTGTRVGIYEAWNLGVSLARGQYITNANADDRHRPDAFEQMVKILDENPFVALVYADVAVTEKENEILESALKSGEFRWPAYNPQLLFQVCYVGPQPMWRQTLHERYGYFDSRLKSAGDYEFWLRICKAETFAHLPEILGLYLLSARGVEHENESLSHKESEIARERYWPPEWGIRPQPNVSFFVKNSEKAELGMSSRYEPLVSIIMPTFNRPQMLLLALESVVNQTYKNWEVIVVNDGGEDVENILSTVFAGDRIVYVRLPKNLERSYARNMGIQLAKGKYIAYLDDDDQFLPDHLETLVTCLESSEYEVAYTDAFRVIHEKQHGRYVETGRDVPYSCEFSRENLLYENFIPILCVMHSRSCFDDVGLFDESLHTHEDWDLWIRLSERAPFHHIKKTTAEFSWRMDGTTTTSSQQEDFISTKARIHDRYGLTTSVRCQNDSVAQQKYVLPQNIQEKICDCSIIIPVFNKVELTKQCLVQLAEVTKDISYEVLLVNNASTDGTSEFLSSLSGDVQVITNEENLGFAQACNQGARAANGKYLVFLNNDTIPLAGWLSALVEEVESHEKVGVVGSKLLYPDETIQHAGVVVSRHYRTPYHMFCGSSKSFTPVNRRKEYQAVTAACMLVRKESFDKVGGFDEDFVNGFEDVDLCLKIRQMNEKVVYQPKSCLYHLESQTSGRKDHDLANANRFLARWDTLWLTDEDILVFDENLLIRTSIKDSKVTLTLDYFQDNNEKMQWGRLVQTQKILLGKKKCKVYQLDDSARISALLREHDLWPADVGALEWGGEVSETLGCDREAQGFWKRVLTLNESYQARVGLARLLIKTSNLGEAQKHIDVLKSTFAIKIEGWILQGVLAIQEHKFLEAKKSFGQALSIDSKNRKACLGMGMACMGLAENVEAWCLFVAEISENPDSLEGLRCLIQVGTVLERWEALANFLRKFVERNPADCEIRFVLAGVEIRAGHSDKAREQLSWFQLIKPDYEGLDDLANALNRAQLQEQTVSAL